MKFGSRHVTDAPTTTRQSRSRSCRTSPSRAIRLSRLCSCCRTDKSQKRLAARRGWRSCAQPDRARISSQFARQEILAVRRKPSLGSAAASVPPRAKGEIIGADGFPIPAIVNDLDMAHRVLVTWCRARSEHHCCATRGVMTTIQGRLRRPQEYAKLRRILGEYTGDMNAPPGDACKHTPSTAQDGRSVTEAGTIYGNADA